MTDEEKFSFDLEGYLVVRNVLTADDLKRLNAVADGILSEGAESGASIVDRVSCWGPKFQALMDHHEIVPYLLELLGPKFRIDHDYCIFMEKGSGARRTPRRRDRQRGGPLVQISRRCHAQRPHRGHLFSLTRQGPVTADSSASLAAINPTLSTACPGTSGASNATPITWYNPKWKRVTRSSSRKPSSTEQNPGRLITIAAPCSTNTAQGTRPGHRDITTPRNTRTSRNSSGVSWRLPPSENARIRLRSPKRIPNPARFHRLFPWPGIDTILRRSLQHPRCGVF